MDVKTVALDGDKTAAAPADSRAAEPEQWTTVIRPHNPWLSLNLLEVWRYRDLVRLFVRRDFVAQYKQTILGPLWFFLQPLFTTLVFTVIFGKIAKIPTDGIPSFLFYFSGMVCWSYFAECLTLTSNTFVTNANLFGKVYFPRIVVPISVVISNILKFFIQFTLFLCFLGVYYLKGAPIRPNWLIITLPLIILQMGLLGIGCGILVSSLTTKYRDLALVVAFGMQLWMFATPVVYPLSQIPPRYQAYFVLNPMTSVIESFRQAFLGVSSLNPAYVVLGWGITLLFLFAGIILFNRIEKTFMDTV
jgi:lipopolysaccharide transport system permease protein